MTYIISVIEIALLLILPLIVFYQRSSWTNKKTILTIVAFYLIWFLSYAFLHELSHLFGSWITGTTIAGYQLIPPFWEGDFKTAYIDSRFENNTQAIVSVLMPYLRDVLFLIVGLWLLKWRKINSYILVGLILTLFILSPLYDIVNNYSGLLFTSSGDFRELSKTIGVLYSNGIGLLFTLIAVLITLRIFIIHKSYPFLMKK